MSSKLSFPSSSGKFKFSAVIGFASKSKKQRHRPSEPSGGDDHNNVDNSTPTYHPPVPHTPRIEPRSPTTTTSTSNPRFSHGVASSTSGTSRESTEGPHTPKDDPRASYQHSLMTLTDDPFAAAVTQPVVIPAAAASLAPDEKRSSAQSETSIGRRIIRRIASGGGAGGGAEGRVKPREQFSPAMASAMDERKRKDSDISANRVLTRLSSPSGSRQRVDSNSNKSYHQTREQQQQQQQFAAPVPTSSSHSHVPPNSSESLQSQLTHQSQSQSASASTSASGPVSSTASSMTSTTNSRRYYSMLSTGVSSTGGPGTGANVAAAAGSASTAMAAASGAGTIGVTFTSPADGAPGRLAPRSSHLVPPASVSISTSAQLSPPQQQHVQRQQGSYNNHQQFLNPASNSGLTARSRAYSSPSNPGRLGPVQEGQSIAFATVISSTSLVVSPSPGSSTSSLSTGRQGTMGNSRGMVPSTSTSSAGGLARSATMTVPAYSSSLSSSSSSPSPSPSFRGQSTLSPPRGEGAQLRKAASALASTYSSSRLAVPSSVAPAFASSPNLTSSFLRTDGARPSAQNQRPTHHQLNLNLSMDGGLNLDWRNIGVSPTSPPALAAPAPAPVAAISFPAPRQEPSSVSTYPAPNSSTAKVLMLNSSDLSSVSSPNTLAPIPSSPSLSLSSSSAPSMSSSVRASATLPRALPPPTRPLPETPPEPDQGEGDASGTRKHSPSPVRMGGFSTPGVSLSRAGSALGSTTGSGSGSGSGINGSGNNSRRMTPSPSLSRSASRSLQSVVSPSVVPEVTPTSTPGAGAGTVSSTALLPPSPSPLSEQWGRPNSSRSRLPDSSKTSSSSSLAQPGLQPQRLTPSPSLVASGPSAPSSSASRSYSRENEHEHDTSEEPTGDSELSRSASALSSASLSSLEFSPQESPVVEYSNGLVVGLKELGVLKELEGGRADMVAKFGVGGYEFERLVEAVEESSPVSSGSPDDGGAGAGDVRLHSRAAEVDDISVERPNRHKEKKGAKRPGSGGGGKKLVKSPSGSASSSPATSPFSRANLIVPPPINTTRSRPVTADAASSPSSPSTSFPPRPTSSSTIGAHAGSSFARRALSPSSITRVLTSRGSASSSMASTPSSAHFASTPSSSAAALRKQRSFHHTTQHASESQPLPPPSAHGYGHTHTSSTTSAFSFVRSLRHYSSFTDDGAGSIRGRSSSMASSPMYTPTHTPTPSQLSPHYAGSSASPVLHHQASQSSIGSGTSSMLTARKGSIRSRSSTNTLLRSQVPMPPPVGGLPPPPAPPGSSSSSGHGHGHEFGGPGSRTSASASEKKEKGKEKDGSVSSRKKFSFGRDKDKDRDHDHRHRGDKDRESVKSMKRYDTEIMQFSPPPPDEMSQFGPPRSSWFDDFSPTDTLNTAASPSPDTKKASSSPTLDTTAAPLSSSTSHPAQAPMGPVSKRESQSQSVMGQYIIPPEELLKMNKEWERETEERERERAKGVQRRSAGSTWSGWSGGPGMIGPGAGAGTGSLSSLPMRKGSWDPSSFVASSAMSVRSFDSNLSFGTMSASGAGGFSTLSSPNSSTYQPLPALMSPNGSGFMLSSPGSGTSGEPKFETSLRPPPRKAKRAGTPSSASAAETSFPPGSTFASVSNVRRAASNVSNMSSSTNSRSRLHGRKTSLSNSSAISGLRMKRERAIVVGPLESFFEPMERESMESYMEEEPGPDAEERSKGFDESVEDEQRVSMWSSAPRTHARTVSRSNSAQVSSISQKQRKRIARASFLSPPSQSAYLHSSSSPTSPDPAVPSNLGAMSSPSLTSTPTPTKSAFPSASSNRTSENSGMPSHLPLLSRESFVGMNFGSMSFSSSAGGSESAEGGRDSFLELSGSGASIRGMDSFDLSREAYESLVR